LPFCGSVLNWLMIKLSQETEALAKRLAAAQRLSVEDAIRQALEEKAHAAAIPMERPRPRDQSPAAIAARRARTDQFVAELAAMPVLDPRSPRDIMDDLDAL
jgi:antitoxin VapB